MAGSFNRAEIIGRLGRDPEIRTMGSGDKLANLRIATSESWRDKDNGERKEKTEWHSVTVWGDALVKIIEQYLSKGMLVHVVGKLETRKWEDQEGKERYSTEIVVRGFGGSVNFWETVSRGGDNGGDNQDYGSRETPPRGNSGRPSGGKKSDYSSELDDDIPF